MKELKLSYQIPISDSITRHKQSELEHVYNNYPKLIQWFLTIFYKENLNFSDISQNEARKLVKELTYPTKDRESKYNCKGAVHFKHSHYYDTAITEAISKWNSFLTWKEKSDIEKNYPEIVNYSPAYDMTMFKSDLEKGWITLNHTDKKLHIPITIPNKKRYENLKDTNITSLKLGKNKDGRFIFTLIVRMRKGSSTDKRPDGNNGIFIKAIDLGECNSMCSANETYGGKPAELGVQSVRIHSGSEIKNLRYKEYHIRRKLQKQSKTHAIPKRRDIESRKVRQWCIDHVRTEMEDIQKAVDAGYEVYVFYGNLKGIRDSINSKIKNKRLRRRLNSFPYDMLGQMLEYMSYKNGARRVKELGEWHSSDTCHKCHVRGLRPTQGCYLCTNDGCELSDYNADANGARNHLGRAVRYLGKAGILGAVA